MKKYLVTYTVLSTRMAEVEAESEEDAFDYCASGYPMSETELDSEYGEDVSCEEINHDSHN